MKKYRKAVFVVTYRKEKGKILYLLLKRKLHWKGFEFPKGGVEYSEELNDAVKREVKEEAGQKAHDLKKYNISGKYKYDKVYPERKGFMGQSFKLFSAEVRGKKIVFDKLEHSGYKWLKYDMALNLLTWNDQKKCLKHVNNKIK